MKNDFERWQFIQDKLRKAVDNMNGNQLGIAEFRKTAAELAVIALALRD